MASVFLSFSKRWWQWEEISSAFVTLCHLALKIVTRGDSEPSWRVIFGIVVCAEKWLEPPVLPLGKMLFTWRMCLPCGNHALLWLQVKSQLYGNTWGVVWKLANPNLMPYTVRSGYNVCCHCFLQLEALLRTFSTFFFPLVLLLCFCVVN